MAKVQLDLSSDIYYGDNGGQLMDIKGSIIKRYYEPSPAFITVAKVELTGLSMSEGKVLLDFLKTIGEHL